MGKIISIHISSKKHGNRQSKKEVDLKENWGIVGDYYAGNTEKQISMISIEIINRVEKSCVLSPEAGSFKENITTEGIDLSNIEVGAIVRIGSTLNQVISIGKTCYKYCEIYKENQNCIVPFNTIFLKVLEGGTIKIEDVIELI